MLVDGDHALLAALEAPALTHEFGGQLLQLIYHFEAILGEKARRRKKKTKKKC